MMMRSLSWIRRLLWNRETSQLRCLCASSCSSPLDFAAAPGTPRERVECVVVGAGVVGLAIARAMAMRGREVVVVEAAPTVGTSTSSRNSEVIHAGIYYPNSSLKADAEVHGATFAFNSSVTQGNVGSEGLELHVCRTEVLTSKNISDQLNADSIILCAKIFINAAGLSAVAIARRLHGFPKEAVPANFYARGCYFSLIGLKNAPFCHLVYPIPEEGGLGVHVTLDLGGQVRFGPDVEWLDNISADKAYKLEFDYSVDPKRAERFFPEIRKYYPSLQDGSLKANYAGIRPKISGPSEPSADFLIQGQESHGIRGLVNLFGIESPGLTASLAIADRVCAKCEAEKTQ